LDTAGLMSIVTAGVWLRKIRMKIESIETYRKQIVPGGSMMPEDLRRQNKG
jgi:hypothetical protein